MTTFILLVMGCVLAGTIARINQSNKLFWILFTSFVVGIAGGSLYAKYNNVDNKKKEVVVSVPTHDSCATVMAIPSVTPVVFDSIDTMSDHVSQDTTDTVTTPSSVCSPMEGNTRIPSNPVNTKVCSHISTQVD